ncbi:RNA helicase [Ephemerocybe angulata]|uniref:RNA helicase n=1 Tax=Ephemerocybe angulata TaxID=980116 RepID=A0A8H6HV56_9AGAR|nr:RNA helicase [Tulosesus angulatus]
MDPTHTNRPPRIRPPKGNNNNRLNPTYCSFFLSPQGCVRGLNCRRRHDIQRCSCGLVLLARNYLPHVRGKRHRTIFAQKKEAEARARGQANQGANVAEEEDPMAMQSCERCKKNIFVASYAAHLDYHARQDRHTAFVATVEASEQDKEGIVVSGTGGIDFGVVDTESSVEFNITVQNTNANQAFSIQTCRMRSSTRGDAHGARFSVKVKGRSRVVRPGGAATERTLALVFHPSFAGQYEDTLEIIFWKHEDLDGTFLITRRVKATVGDRADHEQIRASAPYTGPRHVPKFNAEGVKVVQSLRPPTWTETVWTERLPEFKVPERIVEAAFAPNLERRQNVAKANVQRLMPAVFNLDTYATWWQVLLWVEEEQVKQDLDRYALEDVTLQPNHPRYNLMVPGLAENRPSVLVGDYILLSHTSSSVGLQDRVWFEGRVHDVRMHDVVLAFGGDFSTYKGNKFDVRFKLNRLPFRRMHHALTNKFKPSRILFPTHIHIANVQRVTETQKANVNLYNRQLREDEEQLETVTAILHQKPGSVPFVVFGPPGTGKTVTIIEAMQQLLDKDENIRILACAPSNSAADLLAQRLSNRGPSVVLRLNSMTRRYNDLPPNLREFSCINSNKVFAMPPIEDILKYRVVVATCLTGAAPAGMGMKRGHFTHIFVDEAGQGKEPEVVLPIKMLADTMTNVILAGDNQQLGPVLHSPVASQLGMKTSFLARIMDRDIYDLENGTNGGRGITIVKLIKNFRSHPSILQFSNEQFYNSELRPCGDPVMIRSLETIDELPKKRFPLIFHGMVGKDNREASSPSFFNIDEASQVKKYIKSLLDNSKLRLKAEHIGVITPYHAQRCKILDLLHKDHKMRDIKVGSVEEFQGQERRIIIMSTVRSNTDYVTSDIVRSLGFVANGRRMNVAVTRAQALLIVIGNPYVLSLDPLWKAFMNFIHVNGGWTGKRIDWDPNESVGSAESLGEQRRTQGEREMEETIARIKSMILQRHEDSDFEIDLEDSDDEDGTRAHERPIIREAE